MSRSIGRSPSGRSGKALSASRMSTDWTWRTSREDRRTPDELPAAVLDNVEDATISGSKAEPGTQVFLEVKGAKSRNIYLVGNELHDAAKAVALGADVKDGTVKAVNNF